MDSTQLHDLFRLEVMDTESPYLWSSTEIYSYLDDAQKMFCRLVGGIADSSSPVTVVNAEAGQPFVDISPLILKVRMATLAADGRPLEILNFEDLETRVAGDDYGYRPSYRFDTQPGPIRSIVLGMEANRARLVRVPEEDQQINLITYRLPLTTIQGEDQDLEIDEQHHRHLLYWMMHLAHMKQDAETYDRGRSDTFRAEFLAYCDQAKAERERREHKYRTVSYGGYL